MDAEWQANLRKKHIRLIERTVLILDHILADVTQEQATTYRDGDDGWTTLEVLCHLRDFDQFFYERAVMIIEQDYPKLPAYDHDALAIEHKYNEQDLRKVIADLARTRGRFVDFFHNLADDEWERAGIHPESGHFTLTDALIQVGTHDINHTEQITRILLQRNS